VFNQKKPTSSSAINRPKWEKSFIALKEYYEMNGKCKVSKMENSVLYEWCTTARKVLRRQEDSTGKEYRIAQLNSIGFYWGKDPPSHCLPDGVFNQKKPTSSSAINRPKWEKSFIALKEYYDMNENCKVSKTENSVLYDWCKSARQVLRRQEDSTDKTYRIAQLNSIEFYWGKDPPSHCLPTLTAYLMQPNSERAKSKDDQYVRSDFQEEEMEQQSGHDEEMEQQQHPASDNANHITELASSTRLAEELTSTPNLAKRGRNEDAPAKQQSRKIIKIVWGEM
jgi:hypothetical protein